MKGSDKRNTCYTSSTSEICQLCHTSSPEETMELGRKIGERLVQGDVVALMGDLGTGKTVFTQGLVQGLSVSGYVKSPSFTIVNKYEGRVPVYHLDLYRIGGINEINELGIEEYFYGDGVTIVEWAEKAIPLLPEKYILVKFFYVTSHERKIEISEVDSENRRG